MVNKSKTSEINYFKHLEIRISDLFRISNFELLILRFQPFGISQKG